MGICFVGDSLIRTVQESPELLFYKMDGRDTVRDICFYYKRNRYMTKAMSAFLEAAEAPELISSQII